MIRKTILLLIIAPLATFAQNAKKAPVKQPINSFVLKNGMDTASYAFGLKIATDLKNRGVDSLNYSIWSMAMQQVFENKKPEISQEQAQKVITLFMSSREEENSKTIIAEGDKYLAENKTKPGVVTTNSGLQYIILKMADGRKPKPDAEVTVHYKGTLLNGKQFDSSYDRGEPLSLQLSKVIPGWSEGVQLMQEGSKYKFFVPWKLGYGPQGAGGDIPPYSVLIFEIELLNAGK
ncbi:MAG: FKBP-type peptidyl-prolyl cis-trans isomerase [Flavobacterium sp.]|nr:FKBP-type peptidyl-prolyl cis-trans isomerase [Pedobacter sp.]